MYAHAQGSDAQAWHWATSTDSERVNGVLKVTLDEQLRRGAHSAAEALPAKPKEADSPRYI